MPLDWRTSGILYAFSHPIPTQPTPDLPFSTISGYSPFAPRGFCGVIAPPAVALLDNIRNREPEIRDFIAG
jgi:hypothetical protein